MESTSKASFAPDQTVAVADLHRAAPPGHPILIKVRNLRKEYATGNGCLVLFDGCGRRPTPRNPVSQQGPAALKVPALPTTAGEAPRGYAEQQAGGALCAAGLLAVSRAD